MRAFIKDTPIAPPITPPTACKPAQLNIPPHLARATGGMKRDPIIKPAIAAENTAVANKLIELKSFLSNTLFLKQSHYLQFAAQTTMLRCF